MFIQITFKSTLVLLLGLLCEVHTNCGITILTSSKSTNKQVFIENKYENIDIFSLFFIENEKKCNLICYRYRYVPMRWQKYK
jgi:hypothetical protein